MKLNRFFSWKIFMAVIMFVWAAGMVSVQAQIVTDGLVGFWPLDRATIVGGTAKDMWGSNHGDMIDGPEIVAGKINEALLFDGEASHVEIPHSESLNLDKEITMEFWFLLKGASANNVYPRPFAKGQSTTANGAYGVWVGDTGNSSDIGFRCITLDPNDIRSQAVPDFNDDKWHHVVLTYDGQNGMLYFDGEILVDIPVTGDISQTEDPLHIGDGNSERFFNGAIDEARIYNRALDEDEVRQNFQATSNNLAVIDARAGIAALWGEIKVR